MTRILALLDRIGGDRLARMGIVLVIFIILVRGVRLLVSRSVEEPETRYRINKLIGISAWVIATLLLIGSFSGSLSGVLTSLSVIGAGVAFALQEVIASFAGRLAWRERSHLFPNPGRGQRVQGGDFPGLRYFRNCRLPAGRRPTGRRCTALECSRVPVAIALIHNTRLH